MTFRSIALVLMTALGVLLRAAPLPVEAPGGYILGPHDQVRVAALHVKEIPPDPVTVDEEGMLHLPLLGKVRAGGLTVDELERDLAERLKEFVLEPSVAVTITLRRNLPVSVIGAVKTPGVYQVTEKKRLVEVLSLAGGLREDAGTRLSVNRRLSAGPIPLPGARPDPSGEFSLAEVETEALLAGANPLLNIAVEAGDVISVRRAEIVYVIGEVKKAGGFTLRARETVGVLQAIAMAEGPLASAAQTKAKIMRLKPEGGERIEIAVNLKRVLQGRDPDLAMLPDDILVVPNNTARSIAIRTAEAVVQTATGVIIWRR